LFVLLPSSSAPATKKILSNPHWVYTYIFYFILFISELRLHNFTDHTNLLHFPDKSDTSGTGSFRKRSKKRQQTSMRACSCARRTSVCMCH
jgi:hypothetical protein